MQTQEITIRVSSDAAKVYESASHEERLKLDLLLSLKLGEVRKKKRPLEEIMSEISEKAQKRGLTPEILESILNEQ
ncbi:MAG: hypothetical protein O3B01_23065 [Planctomycetota bacterium]|nr:hypothetical protein [Planctomycetota bacterium]MDA1141452.1 hypothetical protein [Planctomycetota bacterium]